MFKPHYGSCKECSRTNVIIPVKSGLCQYCNHEKKQEAKGNRGRDAEMQGGSNLLYDEVRSHKNKGLSNGSARKTTHLSSLRTSGGRKVDVGRKQEIARGVLRKFKAKTPTGEREIFEQISSERDWRCFVTGVELRELKASTFAHCLPKALNKYPLFKLYKPNIVLLADEIHYAWDFKPRSELKKDPRFDKLFALEEELKQEYKNLKSKP